MASTPSAIANMVLPVPIGPARMTFSAWPIYWQLESSSIFGRETPLSAAQSTCSRVFMSGKRAARGERARYSAGGWCILGFEQFAQQILESIRIRGAPHSERCCGAGNLAW